MNLIQFLSCGVTYGKQYDVTIQSPTDKEPVKERLYFGGFRMKHNQYRIGDENALVPIFFLPKKDGTMSGTTRDGLPTWLEHIIAIENPMLLNGVTDMPFITDQQDVDALQCSIYNLNRIAYNNTLRLMREMNLLFPGKAVRLDPETPVGAVNYYKHGCCPCNIITVAMNDKNTDLVYEVSDYEGENEERDDDDLGFDNRGYLLEALMRCIEEPVFGEYDDEETFIAEGTKGEEIPDPDPEKTPFLYKSGLLVKLKNNLIK